MYGSKIDNLKLLKDNNINVPDFFFISNEDYINNNYQEKIKNNRYDSYSVRSSCNLEDGNYDSFAGQFDTYLNVSKDELLDKIKLCFDSVHNENVHEYIIKHNINENDIKMNVLVQKMINADMSGVLFTSNPQGILNESVIAVSKGLGVNVVQDMGEVTSYYYNTTDKIYYYDGVDYLSKDLVEKLIDLSDRIKLLFGDYLDIEFAILNDEIYILQARKITTIDDSNILVLDNSNIVESYPNISSPLTISFVNSVYSNVFKRLVGRVLKNKDDLRGLDSVLNNMVGSCNGRVYYKISNWYSLLKYIPFSSKIIPIWQDMMGVRVKDNTSTKTNVSSLSRFKVGINYLKELKNSQKNMEMLNEEFLKIEKYYRNKYNENISNDDLLKLYQNIEDKILCNWDITLINDMYAFIFTGILKKYLKIKYKDEYEKITNDYISGISNIESIKPIRELISLAYNEKKYTKNEFKNLKNNYIDLYGDRSLEELKLESKTFRSNPELFDLKIKEYQKDMDKLEILYNDINKDSCKILKEDLIIKFLVKRINSGIKNREISRLNRSRIYGMVREIILTIGGHLEKDDIINKRRDIFYLELEEIFNIDSSIDYKEIIFLRKKQYKKYDLLPAYSRLVFMDKSFDKEINSVYMNDDVISSDEIMGIACSFGEVEGEVLVIDNIENIKDTKDKILVTKMTDPGWVFLIANSKGIISEKGSLLSHTAIISRELKIPSIVGVKNVLKILHTGDYIKMNASTGRIVIEKRNADYENN